MSRTRNAVKMILSSSINQLITVIAGLVLPPLIISHYGSEINGLLNSVKQMFNYFSVVSIGLGAASQVVLYKPLTKDDWGLINKIMAELAHFLNKVGIVFMIFTGVFAFILPVTRQDGIQTSTIAGIVIICGTGSLIELAFLTRYKILLTADQKQYIVSNVYAQGTIINTVLSVLLIWLNASILLVQISATGAFLVRMLLLVRKIHQLYPRLNLNVESNEKCINNSKDALFYKFSDIIINYIPMTFVTFVCGYSDASIYTVYNLIFSAIVMIVNIFSSGLAASFGNLIAQNDISSLKNSFKGYNFIFRTLSFFFYICSAILIIPFVSVYIRNSDGINYLLPDIGIMFTLNGIGRVIRTPYITLIDAVGNYSENIRDNYIEVAINFVISLSLTLKMGMIGVLIGGTISSLVRSIQFLLCVNKQMSLLSSLKEIVIMLINFGIGTLMYVTCKGIIVSNYLQWISAAVNVVIICGITIVLANIFLDFRGFREAHVRIKRIIKR